MPELIILDVGHGNCAVLQDKNVVTVIDCPPNTVLVETLEQLGIDVVEQVLISHADIDHIGGLQNLLGRVAVHNVYINPDADKKSDAWITVRRFLGAAKKFGTRIRPSLTSDLSKLIPSSQVEIEIIAPSEMLALGGSGGLDLKGRKLSSNSLSVVIGLVHKDYRVVLLAGDIDELGLDDLLETQTSIEAKILVFPHHGGRSGGTNQEYEFAEKLCKLVKPDLTVFSFGRNCHTNPRKDILRGVLSAVPNTHILCTQLSKSCAATVPESYSSHVTTLPSLGNSNGGCCGGSILIHMNGKQTTYSPTLSSHKAFIDSTLPEAMCVRQLIEITSFASSPAVKQQTLKQSN